MSAYTDFILRTYYFYFILKTYYFYFILNLRSSDLHSYFVSRIVIQSSSYKTCYKARYRSQSCWKSSNEHTNRNHIGTLIFLHLERWYRPRFSLSYSPSYSLTDRLYYSVIPSSFIVPRRFPKKSINGKDTARFDRIFTFLFLCAWNSLRGNRNEIS